MCLLILVSDLHSVSFPLPFMSMPESQPLVLNTLSFEHHPCIYLGAKNPGQSLFFPNSSLDKVAEATGEKHWQIE